MNAAAAFAGREARTATITRLAGIVSESKIAELKAQATRREAEAELALLIDNGDLESTSTELTDSYKIKIERKLNRTFDEAALGKIYSDIPEAIRDRLIRIKYELDLREYRFIASNEPELLRLIAPAIVTKPAKPAVSVEPIL